MKSHSCGQTIRSRLRFLVIFYLLPIWFAGIALVFYTYQSKCALTKAHMLETARTLTRVVDQELYSIQSAMLILATSPALTSGDLATFHSQARDVLALYPGADIVLADRAGQQVVNTYLPFGAPLPKRSVVETVRHVFSTGEPIISGLFQGKLTGRHMISIDVPVARHGQVIYDLAITVPVEQIAKLLRHEVLPTGSIGTIFDNTRKLVARSQDHEAFVGRFAPNVSPQVLEAQEGTVELVNLAGVQSIQTFTRSPLTQWMVTVGFPKAQVMADLQTWLIWMAGGTSAFSLTILALAMSTMRKLATSVEALAASSKALGQGDLVSAHPLAVTEATDVLQMLAETSRRLHQQAAERDAVEAELRMARAAAEQANISKSKFLAAASHDLRQPLQAMGMFLSVLGMRGDRSDGMLLQNLHHCHASLSEMLSDMLDLGKLEAGVIIPKRTTFKLQDLLEQVVASQAPTAQSKGLSLRLVSTRALCSSDSALLQRVLINLVSNAVRYTKQGGVLVGCRRREGRRWIEVWDTGVGIPEDQIGNIFEEFQQLNNPDRKQEKGSGLGLAIVHKTAALLDHEVRVVSIVGKGSMFAIELQSP